MIEARSILIIDTSSFGETVLLLPVLAAIRGNYPNASICIAATPAACQLCESLRLADTGIGLGAIGSGGNGPGAIARLIRVLRQTRRRRFDLLLDVRPRIETQVMGRLVTDGPVITPVSLSTFVE